MDVNRKKPPTEKGKEKKTISRKGKKADKRKIIPEKVVDLAPAETPKKKPSKRIFNIPRFIQAEAGCSGNMALHASEKESGSDSDVDSQGNVAGLINNSEENSSQPDSPSRYRSADNRRVATQMPYFPLELSVTGDPMKFDFTKRLFDLPYTLHNNLSDDSVITGGQSIDTFDDMATMVEQLLFRYDNQRREDPIDSCPPDALQKWDVFIQSGDDISGRIKSGYEDLDTNLKNVRLDIFGNVMIFGIKPNSDASVVFAHGWPRAKTPYAHGGFLHGNITCMAKISNQRIRSIAKGDVASFVATQEIAGAGLSMSDLLYCRKTALQCQWQKYKLPAQLVKHTVNFEINFKTMGPLHSEELYKIGQETFIPYWEDIFKRAEVDPGTEEESSASCSPESDNSSETMLDIPMTVMKSMFSGASEFNPARAAVTLRRNFTHSNPQHRRVGMTPPGSTPSPVDNSRPSTSTENPCPVQTVSDCRKKGKKSTTTVADSSVPDARPNPSSENILESHLSPELMAQLDGFKYHLLLTKKELARTFNLMTAMAPLKRVSAQIFHDHLKCL